MSVNSFTQTGYINPFICEYLVDLKNEKSDSKEFKSAAKFATRYLEKLEKSDLFTKGNTSKTQITRCRSTKQRSKSAISTIWLFHRCQIFFVGIAFFFIGKAKAQELYRKYCELEEKAEEEPKVLNTSDDWLCWWFKEYRVSMKHFNKRFATSNDVGKRQIIQLPKNFLRTRYRLDAAPSS